MKFLQFIFVSFIFLAASSCGNSEPVTSDEMILPEQGQIGIYYFRTSIRCETCDAIEEIIEDELGNKYAENVKNNKIVFRQYNLDDKEVIDFALKFNVVFQSLIILKDEQQIDLTKEAFLYADSSAEKLRQQFEETLDEL